MILRLSSDDPTIPIPTDLAPSILGLTREEGGFFVLSDMERGVLQGMWEGEGFSLLCQVGDDDVFHEFSNSLEPETVAAIANRFLEGDMSWRTHPDWKVWEIEEAVPEEDGCLGYFDGVGLRHVLRALESAEIEVRLERIENGFTVWVPPENGKAARGIVAELFA